MKTLCFLILILTVANFMLRLLALNHPLRQAIESLKYKIWIKISRMFGYRSSLYQPTMMSSIWLLGLLFNRNPWPVDLYVNHAGVYVTHRCWYGLKITRHFYPMNMVRLVTITEVMGFFAKIKIAVRLDYQLIHIPIDRYFRIDQAEQFFQEWQAHAQLN